MWQVAELPFSFPGASQDSQAENRVLLSSLRLLWRSVLWPLAGCKCWQAGSQLKWLCSSQNFVTALSVVPVLNLCLCHPITEMTCRTCEVHGGTRCVLIYSGSSATWIFILLRIRRKSAFPAILWRALLADSPFLGLFFIGTEPLWMPPLSLTLLTPQMVNSKASAQNPGACWLYQNAAASILEGLRGSEMPWSWQWDETGALIQGRGGERKAWLKDKESVWWGQMDPQLDCCFDVLVEVEGK